MDPEAIVEVPGTGRLVFRDQFLRKIYQARSPILHARKAGCKKIPDQIHVEVPS